MKRNNLKKSIFTIILFIACIYQAHSQEKFNTGFARGTGSIDFIIPTDNFYIGASFGIMNTNNNLRAKLLFAMTPGEKKTEVRDSSKWIKLYNERRYVIGPVLDKHFSLNKDFGLSLEAGYVHTFGNFAGTNYQAEKKWIPILGGGADIILSESVIFRLSYKYMPLPYTKGSVIGISFMI